MAMSPVLQVLRTMGIVIGVAFLGFMLWVAVIGPAILLLLNPHS
jgi:multisubunit Na+/H+ antiporter MnhC subunit